MKENYVLWKDPYFWSPKEIVAWKKDFKDANGYECSDKDFVSIIMEDLDIVRSDLEMMKFGPVIAIAEVNSWDGTKTGYKEYDDLSKILYSECDYCKWYIDRFNVRSEQVHHDGTNYIMYRVRKDNISDADWDAFKYKIATGRYTSHDITRYTKSIKDIITGGLGV